MIKECVVKNDYAHGKSLDNFRHGTHIAHQRTHARFSCVNDDMCFFLQVPFVHFQVPQAAFLFTRVHWKKHFNSCSMLTTVLPFIF